MPLNVRLIRLFSLTLLLSLSSYAFNSEEHKYIGDQVKVCLPTHNKENCGSYSRSKMMLTLPNGLKVSYGDIIFLAGDLYGVPDEPISSGKTTQSQQQRFIAAFNSLAKTNDLAEAHKLLGRVHGRLKLLLQGLKNGVQASTTYKKIGSNNDYFNVTTGGGGKLKITALKDIFPYGRYIKLANKNLDHFENDALIAYNTGHTVALRTALTGQLELAYEQNAFASHYLTDSYAAGHMRSPRRVMYNRIHLPLLGKLLLTNLMHDEDNCLGLQVSNQNKDLWQAYGDGRYLDDVNKHARSIINTMVNCSANEIYQTYKQKKIVNLGCNKYLPIYQSSANTAPRFRVKNGCIQRRKDFNNPYNYKYRGCKWWNSAKTLLQYYPYKCAA